MFVLLMKASSDQTSLNLISFSNKFNKILRKTVTSSKFFLDKNNKKSTLSQMYETYVIDWTKHIPYRNIKFHKTFKILPQLAPF